VILAIDPGNTDSAFVLYDGKLHDFGKVENDTLLARLPSYRATAGHMAIEMIASYGMPVGREVFETCLWIGRLIQAWRALGGGYTLVYRKDIKLHLCNSPRADDSTIRQALIDRYGGKRTAIGLKASPGPLYGVKADVWSALAIAVTHTDSVRQIASCESVEGLTAASTERAS
jgi:hypothetical protein